jgi:hypothetical protein
VPSHSSKEFGDWPVVAGFPAAVIRTETAITNIQRSGDIKKMQGYNSNTGSSWSQNSIKVGEGMAVHNGTAANGNSWSGTSMSLGGGMTHHSSNDSDGNYYSKTCIQYGCN